MNIRRLIVIFFLALACFSIAPCYASETNIITQADSAYSTEQYTKAIELYNKAIAETGTSSDLYYNLGNAYYKNGDLGKAVVNFHRSLKLNPTNDEAKQNIRFLKTKLIDKVGESGSFFSNTFDSFTNIASSNTWAWISLTLFLLTMAEPPCIYSEI